MPKHDETDAPGCTCEEPEPVIGSTGKPTACFYCGKLLRPSKTERWGVEDKVVDGETK